MSEEHRVTEGDTVTKLAVAHGFLPDTIWEHPENEALRAEREDRDVLLPGDVVVIPDKNPKHEVVPVDRRHRVRRKGVPSQFRLRLSKGGVALAGVAYLLEIEGEAQEGHCDEEGWIQAWIPPGASEGRLTVRIEGEEIELPMYMDTCAPHDTYRGARRRLRNLGFFPGGAEGEELDEELRAALMDFQRQTALEVVDGELNEETAEALRVRHDEAELPEPMELPEGA
jgi:hypothetical protein